MNSLFFCIDFKSFYASVECVDRSLDPLTTPLVVADVSRGMNTICLAISPALKKLGAPGRARLGKLDPNWNFLIAKPRMQRYIDVAADIYGLYLDYFSSEDIHVYSIDEAFIDVTPYLKMYQLSALELANKIARLILEKTGITAAVGIGTNLFLAKASLDLLAKKGQADFILTESEFIKRFGAHQPLTDFWHIGPGIQRRLNALGIYTLNQVASADPALLKKEFGINSVILQDHARGVEPTTMAEIKAYLPTNRSLTVGQVLPRAYTRTEGATIINEMAEELVLKMTRKKLSAALLGMMIGSAEGAFSESFAINSTSSLAAIRKLLVETYYQLVPEGAHIHRLHIYASKLGRQIRYSLFDDHHEIDLLETINSIKARFGANAIAKVNSLTKEATGRRRRKEIGGHNAV